MKKRNKYMAILLVLLLCGVVVAGTITLTWQDTSWIAGGASSWDTLSGTTESDSDVVDMVTGGYSGAFVTVEIDYNDTTPTAEVNILIYPSYDGTNFDDTPMWSMQGDLDVDPQQLSFVIRDIPYFKVSFAQDDTADDEHVIRANIREYYPTAN